MIVLKVSSNAKQSLLAASGSGHHGGAVLDGEEMGEAQRDTAIATVIALVGVTLLDFSLFKSVVRPLLALAALGTVLCWSLGLTTLTIGHLNILTGEA